MKLVLLICCVWFISTNVFAEVITNGVSIDHATSAMNRAGYKQAGLDMMPNDGEGLRFWNVDQGILILRYSAESRAIVGLSFWLSDGRPKASRKVFEFEVTSFDADSGVMTVRTTKGESDDTATRSQAIRSEKDRTSSAAGFRH